VYDAFFPWEGAEGREGRHDYGFYLPLALSAAAVLDAGCGTGSFLHGVRDAGHPGRLCGLDPACAMLARARRRTDVDWVLGDLSSARWDREFDLVVMTGHAFQVLLGDEELRAALAAIRAALTDEGRFAFETRNPPYRAWERWTPEHAVETTTETGAVVRMAHQVETPVDETPVDTVENDVVSFATTFTSPAWDRPEVSRSTLRFLGAEALDGFLAEAGLAVHERYGDFDRSPLTAASPEIVTIAERA
jgi:SAM-dependent methyltransferase